MGGRLLLTLVLLVGLALAALLSVGVGSRTVPIVEVAAALAGDTSTVDRAAVAARVPRTVLALLVGGALAVSGATFQAVTRNPLGDPGILGVNGGAALAVVLGITVVGISTPVEQLVAALVGAGVAAVLVHLIASIGTGGATPLKLALAGSALSAAFLALVGAVTLPRADVMETFRFWQVGGVGGATWGRILTLAPVLVAAVALSWGLARSLNSLALGDDVATSLGLDVLRTRALAAAAAVALAAGATAVAGPIGFIGLVVPHACRLVVGPDHRWLLPLSGLSGALLLTVSDVVGRVVARPGELEVGIVTAFIGAPVFIAIVRSRKVTHL